MKINKTVWVVAGAMLLGSLPLQAARVTTVPLAAAEQNDLLYMREEEKLARDTYLTLYEQWGNNAFSNISNSEQSHMDAILVLIKKYALPDPAASTAIGVYRNTELQALYNDLIELGTVDVLAALRVGALIEETDMRDIVVAIERSQHADIDKTYGNLLCGSRNHLRAFVGQIVSITGVHYTAQLLDQYEVDNIINAPTERCGR